MSKPVQPKKQNSPPAKQNKQSKGFALGQKAASANSSPVYGPARPTASQKRGMNRQRSKAEIDSRHTKAVMLKRDRAKMKGKNMTVPPGPAYGPKRPTGKENKQMKKNMGFTDSTKRSAKALGLKTKRFVGRNKGKVGLAVLGAGALGAGAAVASRRNKQKEQR